MPYARARRWKPALHRHPMFELRYEPLSLEHPEWGSVALLPWDAEILGFGVADYRWGTPEAMARQSAAFREALAHWAAAGGVEAVVCCVPPEDRHTLSMLPSLGFLFFDYTYEITLSRLQATSFPAPRVPVRLAESSDGDEVERIAEQVFRFGRYHADPYIPRHLANARYRKWLRGAFAGRSMASRMYVAGAPGNVRGFFHAELWKASARITIIAVDTPFQRGLTGFSLVAGVLNDLKRAGIQRVSSKISAANLGVLNLAAAFGFRYGDPQAVYYWHPPDAKHLVRPGEALPEARTCIAEAQ